MKLKLERKLNYEVTYQGGFGGTSYDITLTAKPTDNKNVFGSLARAKRESKIRLREAQMSASDRDYKIYCINELTITELCDDYDEDIEVNGADIHSYNMGV